MNVAIALPADVRAARALLARGRRLAARFGASWVALLVQTGPRERRAAGDLDQLVTSLGGELRCTEGQDVAFSLIDLSEREHTDLLVIGASRRPTLLRRFSIGTTEKLLRASRSFHLVVAAAGADA